MTEAPAATRNTRWGTVVVACAAGVVAATQLGKVPPVMSEIRDELALDMVAGGWVASIFNATAAVIGILAGIFADSLGHRRAMALGIACIGLGSLAGAYAESGTVLLLTRFLEGVGFVSVVVAAPSLIAAACGSVRHRNLALGAWGGYFPLGWGMMVLAAPFIVEPFGWRGLWWASAGLMAAFLVVLAVESRMTALPTPRPAPVGLAQRFADIRSAVVRPGPWLLAASFAMFAIQWVGLMAWLPTFFVDEQGYSFALASALTAVVVMCEVFGNVVAGWLLALGFARWRLIAISIFSMSVLSLVILAPAVPGWARFVLACLFSAIGGMIPAAVLAGGPVHAPSPRLIGTVNGVLVQGSNVGNLLGPPVFATAVLWLGGFDRASWAMVGFGVVGVVVAFLVRIAERRL